MSDNCIHDVLIPACTGKALNVARGQSLRVIDEEGKQVAAAMFFNAHNYKEQGMAEFSGGLSYFQPPDLGKIGSHYRLGELYSKVPYENLMMTVTQNDLGDHFLGTHCSELSMALLGAPGHRSCSDNFAEALAEFGLELEDVYSPSVVNIFSNARIDTEGDGSLLINPPRSVAGDYVEFLAHMDLLVAISACPDDVTAKNDHSCKSIRIQIYA